MRNTSLFVLIGLSCALLACGQKGPLVLPDAQHPRKKIGVPKRPTSPAPASPSHASPAPTPAAPEQ